MTTPLRWLSEAADIGKIEKLVAKWRTGEPGGQPYDAPASKDPQALPSAKELALTERHQFNALHLEAKFKRLDRSVNRYRDSIRIFT